MRKSLVSLTAALAILPALCAAPATAQTQSQTYGFGRADFCRGPVEARRAVRLWLMDPDLYEFLYRAPTPPRPIVINCNPHGHHYGHHGLVY